MADYTISPDASAANQAFEISRQNAADQGQRSGKHVVGDAKNLVPIGGALGATAAGTAQDVDGVGGVTAGANQVKNVVNADAPTLPDPSGPSASPATTMRVVRGSDVFAGGGDSLFAALQGQTEARQHDVNDAGLLKRLQGQNQVGAKQEEMHDKEQEIKGQNITAIVKFAGSLTGVAATGALSFGGSKMESSAIKREADSKRKKDDTADAAPLAAKPDSTAASDSVKIDVKRQKTEAQQNADGTPGVAGTGEQNSTEQQGVDKLHKEKDDEAAVDPSGTNPSGTPNSSGASTENATSLYQKHQAHIGAATRNIGMNVSSLFDSTTNLIDMQQGGQRMSNEAAVNQKQDAIQGQIYQNNADSANTWLEAARDQRKSTQQDLMTVVQRHEQAGLKVWGG